IRPIARHALWNDVGAMAHVPIGSTVLQRKHSYKAVLRHHLALRAAARLPIDARALDKLLGMKDVATLYELWTFFKVVAALEKLLGPPDHVDRAEATTIQLGIPWSFRASWDSVGVSAFYNLSFSAARKAPYRSSSVMLRPDVVVQCGTGADAVLHVLDAKLRVDVETSDDEDEDDERSSKRDDIKKMHTYRDALPNVRTAFVLYPGNVFVEYAALDQSDGDTVGAIPLTPGADASDLDRHLTSLIDRWGTGLDP
uniref:nuclease domain-containing protein n=1 Tax=Gemmatimonas sp. TaxID=1962908 RepID=UPI003983B4BF